METFKEDLGETPLCLLHPRCWSFKAPALQVGADPWGFTVDEQVDEDVFYGPMLPAQRRVAASMSLGIRGKGSFMSCWGAPGRQEGVESLQDHQGMGFAGA